MYDLNLAAQSEAFKREARKIQLALFPGVLREFAREFHTADNKLPNLIYNSILGNRPLSFVGFWGVGGKRKLDRNDAVLVNFYGDMISIIAKYYDKGLNLTIILADIHGRFNGLEPFPYLDDVQERLTQAGIQSLSLASLYESWDLEIPSADEPIDYNSDIFRNFFSSNSRYQHAATIMINNARKHNLSSTDPERAAYQYVKMRLQEVEVLEGSFPDSILLVNSSKDLAMPVLPRNMPHMYTKVGPVWFMNN